MTMTNENVISHVTDKAEDIKSHVTGAIGRLEARYNAIEAKADELLLGLKRKHWSAIGGVLGLFVAGVFGDLLGMARLIGL